MQQRNTINPPKTVWSTRSVLAELRRHWVWPGLVALVIIVLDQAAKAWIWRMLGPIQGTSRPLIGSWLSFTLVKNDGVAFGLFPNIPHFFTITSVLISLGAIYFYRFHLPKDRLWVQISLGLIVGGAIGNIIDRLRFGFVIDFVHISWFPGVFNMADSAITIGVIMLASFLLLLGDQTTRVPPTDDGLLNELLNQDRWSRRGGRQG
jgi:signal peptidase II